MLKKITLLTFGLLIHTSATAEVSPELIENTQVAVLEYLLKNDPITLKTGVNVECTEGEVPSEISCDLPGHKLDCSVTIHNAVCRKREPLWESVVPKNIRQALS